MSEQRVLRRRIRSLERLQAQRIALVAEQKKALDSVVEQKQREINNLKTGLTIGVAR